MALPRRPAAGARRRRIFQGSVRIGDGTLRRFGSHLSRSRQRRLLIRLSSRKVPHFFSIPRNPSPTQFFYRKPLEKVDLCLANTANQYSLYTGVSVLYKVQT
ncbi:UNVERIFIED_CONTAM: hypothetical protein PYX00_001945 [Menopon gallinae]|uniref:Ribosomal protein L2 n=1 Tax=Menopon gallinae TaxID=328185 RepID=A0AAW2IGG9_9NEOP